MNDAKNEYQWNTQKGLNWAFIFMFILLWIGIFVQQHINNRLDDMDVKLQHQIDLIEARNSKVKP